MATLACGNCVCYAMWQRFPPTSSWVILIPIWFLALSAVHSFGRARLRAIPPFLIAVPLIGLVTLLAPGMIGPPLGFWIPVCCIVGTIAGPGQSQPRTVRKIVAVITVITATALIGFGVRDYIVYFTMPDAERARYRPAWEVPSAGTARPTQAASGPGEAGPAGTP